MKNQKAAKKFKVVFMGTPEFALPSLEVLYQDPIFKIVLVVTEIDRPAERNLKIQNSAIKKMAQKLGLKIFQPKTLKNPTAIKRILDEKPDLIITVAYGQFLPKKLLGKTINLHPSLLPKFRGPSPIQAAILNGENKTGITVMLSDEKMDHGPILAQKEIAIQKNYTFLSLSKELAKIGSAMLIDTVKKYLNGKIQPKTQDHQKTTICKLIKKEDGELDFNKKADLLEREIRAYYPWPGSYTQSTINNKQLTIKILKVEISKIIDSKIKIGKFYSLNKKELYINCQKYALKVLKLQIESKNPIGSQDFINGYLK